MRKVADLTLVLVTLLWGSTFVMVKNATREFPVFAFLALRFGLALWVLIPVLILVGRREMRRGRPLGGRRQWLAGLVTGFFLFGGYALQTLGLQSTGAGRAGFITGLSVVIVPFISAVLLRERPGWPALVGVGLAVGGLALMFLPGEAGGGLLAASRGDLLVLGCAFAFAAHVVAIGRFGRQMHEVTLSTVQVAVVFVASMVASAGWEQSYWHSRRLVEAGAGVAGLMPPGVWGAAAFTGVVVTAGGLLVQTRAQRETSAVHAALIFSLEPVFALLFGYLLAGERLGLTEAMGSALVLLGMLVSEVEQSFPIRRACLRLLPAPALSPGRERGRCESAPARFDAGTR